MVKLTFGKYLLFMVREAIEPILLVSGLAILFSRIQSISEDVYYTTGSQGIWDILRAIYDDMESDPMIYWILVAIFGLWILYRAWRLKKELQQDEYNKMMLEIHNTQTTILNKLAGDISKVKDTLKDIERKLPND
jgi:hypothetical protein